MEGTRGGERRLRAGGLAGGRAMGEARESVAKLAHVINLALVGELRGRQGKKGSRVKCISQYKGTTTSRTLEEEEHEKEQSRAGTGV